MLPRILVVVPALDIGGTEMHLAHVVPQLRCRGLDVSVFVLARGGRLESGLADAGVPLGGPHVRGPRLWRNLRAGYALRRELRRLRPDVVHFFLPEAYLVGGLACVGYGRVPRLMSRRSLAHYQRNHPLLPWVERRQHRSTTALLGNSAAVVAELVDECGAPDKVGLIHNGVVVPPPMTAERRHSARRELSITADAFALLVVANLIAYKGHADLIEALGLMRDRLAAGWRLILVGRDGGIGNVLRRRATTLGLADNLMWLDQPRATQVPLDAADVALLPSHQEGFSNSLLEKMAQGLPVIATAVGGNLDAVVDGSSGRLVPVGDAAALGAAIVELHDDPALRRRMGDAARDRVERLFSLDACVERYLNLYRGYKRFGEVPVATIIEPPAATVDLGRVASAAAEYYGGSGCGSN